jgi:hypothetical protein
MGYYSTTNNKMGISSFGTTWMETEDYYVEWNSQAQKDRYPMISLVFGIKKLGIGDVAQATEHLLCKCEALSWCHRSWEQNCGYQRLAGWEIGGQWKGWSIGSKLQKRTRSSSVLLDN